MYCCLCYTCDEEELVDDFASAQELFNDHAASYHEVELFNLDVVGRLPTGAPSASEATGRAGEAADE